MKKKIAVTLLALTIGAVSLWALTRTGQPATGAYRFVTVERGDIRSVVTATGTLSAVTTVEVGTQVSGILAKIFVDFNDPVQKGQVLALIDPTLLQIAVRNAEANLEKNQAQLNQATRDYERAMSLRQQQILSETDYSQAQTNLDMARAGVKSAAVALDQAKQNLTYATIYAPISGTVVERDVDVGQTVAASLSAPKLFTIAGDLARMQILASVDESDIGNIREGQTAEIKVQAYPAEAFTGKVRQVRLQSTTQENVVNYTVVVDVRNDDHRLLPGMTATVSFVVAQAADVLKVPNAALRVVPTAEMLAELRAGRTAQSGDQSKSRADGQSRTPRAGMGRLYSLNNGRLAAIRVKTGLTDGKTTEVQGEGLKEGAQVIGGVTQGTAAQASSNPFQTQGARTSGRPGPGGPGF